MEHAFALLLITLLFALATLHSRVQQPPQEQAPPEDERPPLWW